MNAAKKLLFLTLALLLLIQTPAYAMEFQINDENKMSIYASIRSEAHFKAVRDSDTTVRDKEELKLSLQPHSRFGVTWTSGNAFAVVETGLRHSDDNNWLRLAYFGYKIDGGASGTISFGQMYSPSETLLPHYRVLRSDSYFDGSGGLTGVRRPTVHYNLGNFDVALRLTEKDYSKYTQVYVDAGYTDVSIAEKMPKIVLAYKFPSINFRVAGAFAYLSLDAIDAAGHDDSYDAIAYHVLGTFTPQIGNLSLGFTGFYAQNAGLYGMLLTGNGQGDTKALVPTGVKRNGDIHNVKSYSFGMNFHYKINEMYAVAGGAAYINSSADNWTDDDDAYGVYLSSPIRATKYLLITPEISYDDFRNTDVKGQRDVRAYWVGAQFRFDI